MQHFRVYYEYILDDIRYKGIKADDISFVVHKFKRKFGNYRIVGIYDTFYLRNIDNASRRNFPGKIPGKCGY